MNELKKAASTFSEMSPHVSKVEIFKNHHKQSKSSTTASYSEIFTVIMFAIIATALICLAYSNFTVKLFGGISYSGFLGNLLITESISMVVIMLLLLIKNLYLKKKDNLRIKKQRELK